MKVTDKEYYMEKKLIEKLDLMIKRMTGKSKDDNLVLIDGDEGQGKSNIAVEVGYYVAHESKRPFSLENVFFDLEALIKFAISTNEQVIIWDEGALGGLAIDWWNKNQKKFIKLLMVARKKKHFFIICIPKFFKLNEYLVVDRSIGLIHVYSRGNIQKGRFCYFNKVKKELLYYDWKKTRKRSYKKHISFWGSFPEAIGDIINEDEYDAKKEEAIMSIDNDDDRMTRDKEQLIKLKYGIYTLPNFTAKQKAKHFGINPSTLFDWAKLNAKYPDIVGIEG